MYVELPAEELGRAIHGQHVTSVLLGGRCKGHFSKHLYAF